MGGHKEPLLSAECNSTPLVTPEILSSHRSTEMKGGKKKNIGLEKWHDWFGSSGSFVSYRQSCHHVIYTGGASSSSVLQEALFLYIGTHT